MDKSTETYHRNNMRDSKPGSFGYEQSKKALEQAGIKTGGEPAPDANSQAEGIAATPLPSPTPSSPSGPTMDQSETMKGMKGTKLRREAIQAEDQAAKNAVGENQMVDMATVAWGTNLERELNSGARNAPPIREKTLLDYAQKNPREAERVRTYLAHIAKNKPITSEVKPQ